MKNGSKINWKISKIWECFIVIYIFHKKQWLCEYFFNKKLEMIICQYDNFVEISNNEQIKKVCNQI